jgi:hypothetical protein
MTCKKNEIIFQVKYKNIHRMENIALLPSELSSKIFYYVGNTNPCVNELKMIINKMSNDDKCITAVSKNFSRISEIYDEYDEYYCYYIRTITDESFGISINVDTVFGDFFYTRKMDISTALLFAINNRPCMVIEKCFENIINKLKFNIFNISFVDIDIRYNPDYNEDI